MQPIEKIEERCKEQNLTFIGFNNKENKYVNNKTKLILKCNKCGYQWDTSSYDKFVGKGSRKCPKCSGHYIKSENEYKKLIVNRCKELDYTIVGYDGTLGRSTKLKLKCNKCGYEWETTTVNNFLKKGRTSHTCGRKNPSEMPQIYTSKEEIEKRVNEKLDGTSLKFISIVETEDVKYGKQHIKVRCKKCGKEYTLTLLNILYGGSLKCKKCEYNGKFNDDYVRKLILDKCKILGYELLGFDTDDGKYNGKDTKLILKCNKCGRIWKSTDFNNFSHFTIKCEGCLNRWKLEDEVKYILSKNNIEFEQEKKFDWLKYSIKLSLDFYLPKYNIFIECQGRQHFEPVDCYGGENEFKLTEERDKTKYTQCIEHGLIPIYYGHKKIWERFNGIKLVEGEEELIENIEKYGQKNKSTGSTQ